MSDSVYPESLDNLDSATSVRVSPDLTSVLNNIEQTIGVTGDFNFDAAGTANSLVTTERTRAEAAEGVLAGDISGFAPLNSPIFTGSPKITSTPSALDNSTKIADTAYADAAVGVEKTRAEAEEASLAAAISGAAGGASVVVALASQPIASSIITSGGLPMVDNGYTLAEGDRVLVVNQAGGGIASGRGGIGSTDILNGIWIAHASIPWARPADYASGVQFSTHSAYVTSEGDDPSGEGQLWTTGNIALTTIDTTATSWGTGNAHRAYTRLDLNDFGADPTGVADCTNAWINLMNALPVKTFLAWSFSTKTLESVNVPCGIIQLGVGNYKFQGSAGPAGEETQDIGPCVTVRGVAHEATVCSYYGRNSMFTASSPFSTHPAAQAGGEFSPYFTPNSMYGTSVGAAPWPCGGFEKLTLEGSNILQTASTIRKGFVTGGPVGLTVLMGEEWHLDIALKNWNNPNFGGAVGVVWASADTHLWTNTNTYYTPGSSNAGGWNESGRVKLYVNNCDTGMLMLGKNSGSSMNDCEIEIRGNQFGGQPTLVIDGGTSLYNGKVKLNGTAAPQLPIAGLGLYSGDNPTSPYSQSNPLVYRTLAVLPGYFNGQTVRINGVDGVIQGCGTGSTGLQLVPLDSMGTPISITLPSTFAQGTLAPVYPAGNVCFAAGSSHPTHSYVLNIQDTYAVGGSTLTDSEVIIKMESDNNYIANDIMIAQTIASGFTTGTVAISSTDAIKLTPVSTNTTTTLTFASPPPVLVGYTCTGDGIGTSATVTDVTGNVVTLSGVSPGPLDTSQYSFFGSDAAPAPITIALPIGTPFILENGSGVQETTHSVFWTTSAAAIGATSVNIATLSSPATTIPTDLIISESDLSPGTFFLEDTGGSLFTQCFGRMIWRTQGQGFAAASFASGTPASGISLSVMSFFGDILGDSAYNSGTWAFYRPQASQITSYG